jgi:hypothetical protein
LLVVVQNSGVDTPAATAGATSLTDSRARRRYLLAIACILTVAGVWRGLLAAAMPCLSRDGVLYCWYARDLGTDGPAALKADEFQQHPLFPLTILGVQRTLAAFGVADTPLAWQRSGQIVTWVAGVVLVVVTGLLTTGLVRRLELPLDSRTTGLCAMILAAILPLNTWLSADVMSEQMHVTLYLGGVILLLRLDSWKTALGCGVLSGLAFLTRLEGAVVCFAAFVVLLAQVRTRRLRVLASRAAMLALGFLVCATPYFAISGKVSPKLQKETLDRFQASLGLPRPLEAREPGWQHAALLRRDVDWYWLVPMAVYITFRAGRVIVPLLALPPLVHLRRRFGRPPLLGLGVCALTHFSLTVILLERHGYLAPRHTLVVVMLAVPFAGMFMMHVLCELSARRRRWLARGFAGLCLLPLAIYSLRVPHGADAFVAQAARWLQQHDPQVESKLLLGGSSQRRLAFYANMRMQAWPENEPTLDRCFDELRAHLVGSRPDYFAIESGPGEERAGNDQLLERLRADDEVAAHVTEVHVERTPRGDAMHIWQFTWD